MGRPKGSKNKGHAGVGHNSRKAAKPAPPPVELMGNLAAREEEVRKCKDQYDKAMKRREEANGDAKNAIDKAEGMGIPRKAFKDACKAVTNMDPDKRRRYDEGVAFCRQAFGFSLDGQGQLYEGGDADQAAAGGAGDAGKAPGPDDDGVDWSESDGDEAPGEGDEETVVAGAGMTAEEADARVAEVRERVANA